VNSLLVRCTKIAQHTAVSRKSCEQFRLPVVIVIIIFAKLLLPTEQREAQALVTFAAKETVDKSIMMCSILYDKELSSHFSVK
jgi:hypothetical protein